MRRSNTRYPVDRYMVESSRKYEMVNIIDDDLWHTEPALKPEDELILRKLHEMLQSTADDLKLLSGELSKFHEPGVQIKSAPTPLDDEFNEKVHIEEIVNAKFHGYKIIDKPSNVPVCNIQKDKTNNVKPKDNINVQKNKNNNANAPLNTARTHKKPSIKNLARTRTKLIQIDGNQDSINTEKLNNAKVVNAPVIYNEYSFKYVEPELKTPRLILQVQKMPSINIRSELKEQKVLHLDIFPDTKETEKLDNIIRKNVAVVAVQHQIPAPVLPTISTQTQKPTESQHTSKPVVRKVSKMSTCVSTPSSNVSSDTQIKLKTQQRLLANIKSTKHISQSGVNSAKMDSDKRSHSNINEWRKKLSVVYGSSQTKNKKSSKVKSKHKSSPKKRNVNETPIMLPNSSGLNNSEYIPYSKLTIGGVRASDIEKEISEIPDKCNVPLSPILDRILSSRENSYTKTNTRKAKINNKFKVLTTSDENLLQEVIDIEKTVSETLSKKNKHTDSDTNSQAQSLNDLSDADAAKLNESYADDFEDEKSVNSEPSNSNESSKRSDADNICLPPDAEMNNDNNVKNVKTGQNTSSVNNHNLTYTKNPKLSIRNKIDIFEFVHSVDTQDSATQSIVAQRISPKETQTTPRSEAAVQPIHNVLWPSIDPKGQVEKMFELEKDLIKKLLIEEYGDLLERNITKPSTSGECVNKQNIIASQKNTQTSPAHVKNVMTSPTRTKTRTTSPFVTAKVDHHTSPLVFGTNEKDIKQDVESDEADLGISINLSSPRFSLRLPRNSQEAISNIEGSAFRTGLRNTTNVRNSSKAKESTAEMRKSDSIARKSATDARKGRVEVKKSNLNITTTSTSSIEAESSEISSLGEIRLKRMLSRQVASKYFTDWDSASSSSSKSSDFHSGVLPLRSEGEMSLGCIKRSNIHSKSEGEASFVGM